MSERKLASPEDERRVRELFPLHMPPGEYAVRYADDRAVFHYAALRFRDEHTQRWLQTVSRILASSELLDRCRERFKNLEDS